MSANTAQIFPAAPAAWNAQISQANTARDGTGTITDVAEGGTNGARVDRVSVKPVGSTLAGMIRFWLHDGSSYRLLEELAVGASVASALSKPTRQEWVRLDKNGLETGEPVVLLGPGQNLAVSTHAATTFDVVAFGGVY